MPVHPLQTRDGPRNPVATRTRDPDTIGPLPARRDEDLLEDYAMHGTRDAFEELVHRYEQEMYSYLHRYLRSKESAEDVFQAAFLQVHLKCRQFDPCRRFRPWLYRIATNLAIDLLRQSRRHNMVSLNAGTLDWGSNEGMADQILVGLHDAGPSEQLEAAEVRQRIQSAVDECPTRLKAVLELVMFRGLKYQEAADMLGIPLGSVKSRMHEAVVRLRNTFMAQT
jgi:RNA polymerase sigma-70 factor, ECF subfamily